MPSPKKFSIFGIDASSSRLAATHLSSNGKIQATMYIDTPNGNSASAFNKRYADVCEWLFFCAEPESYFAVYIEDAYMGVSRRGSVNHAKVVGNVISAASEVARDLNVDPDDTVRVIMPATWRSLCGIKGRGKAPVAEWALNKWGNKFLTNQDLIDASCIAFAGCAQTQTEHVDTLRKKGII